MLMLITAAASAASRRRSQCTWLPSPIGAPWTTTSNTPPTVSPAERASSTRAIIAASASGSGQRSGEASASSRDRVARAGSNATPPTSAVNDQTSIPSSRRNARAIPPTGHPRRRLARRRPLEGVADVVEAVLERGGEVRVAGPDAGDRRRPLVALGLEGGERRRVLVGQRLDLHDLGPVRPVAVLELQQDRRPERPPVPDAGQDLRPVLLDRLARAAPVPALAPREVDGDVVLGQREPGRHPLDDRAERGAVALAGGQEPEAVHGSRRRCRRAAVRPRAPAPPARPRPRRRHGRARRPARPA